jgi:hypothetical protein
VEDSLLLNPQYQPIEQERTVSGVAREFASQCTHETFDYVAESGEILPLIGEGVRTFGNKVSPGMLESLAEGIQKLESAMLPNGMASLADDDHRSLMEKYQDDVAEGHQTIDRLFSTDQAEKYTPEVKENPLDPRNQMVIGILPPPFGMLGEVSSTAKEVAKDVSSGAKEIAAVSKNLNAAGQSAGVIKGIPIAVDKLSEAGKVIDRGGLTKAGRGLMKHGYREGSVFPKPMGNHLQINKEGQFVLEKILNDPNKKVYRLADGSLKIYSADGRGAFFKQDGSFRGFIEQQYE